LARGDVALSISLTAGSSMVSFITVPILMALAVQAFGGEGTPIELSMVEMVATLFGATALPVLLGMATLHARPALAERLHRPLLGISGTVLLILIVGLGFSVWGSVDDMAGLATRATPPVFLLIAVSTGIGFGGAWLLGLPAATGRTLGIEIGIQNFNLAMVVAFSILDEPLYLGSALIYLPVMMTFAGAIIALGRRARDVGVRGGLPVDTA
jgi:BASS family bile acid:Na+ symporter